MTDIKQIFDFEKAMNEHGLYCNDVIIADGKIHRFKTSKTGKDGWYIFYGNYGAFGDWRRDIKETWVRSDAENLSAADKAKLDQLIQQSKESIPIIIFE